MKQNRLGVFSVLVLTNLLAFGQVSRADDKNLPIPSAGIDPALHRSLPADPVVSLGKALDLTPDQQEKLRVIFKDQREKISTLRLDTSLSPETRRSKFKEIHEVAEAAIKAVLTPDQLVKLEKMKHAGRADMPPLGVQPGHK